MKYKEITDELQLIQEIVTVKKNTSPLQMKILLTGKFSSIKEYLPSLENDEKENGSIIATLTELLTLISEIEFKKPVDTSDLLWLNMYYIRVTIARILLEHYTNNDISLVDNPKVVSIIINVPKMYVIDELEANDAELAFALTSENFKLLKLVVSQMENTKIYSFKEWLNITLKNHYNFITKLRNEWNIMNYSQSGNFKDLSVVIGIFMESIALFIDLYSIMREHKYLLEPTDIFNCVDDFQFISAIIKFKEELDLKVSGLNKFRDDKKLDKTICLYEQYKLVPVILYHIRELFLSNYTDSNLISFCNNDIKQIHEYFEKNSDFFNNPESLETVEGLFHAKNLESFLYLYGIIARIEKKLDLLNNFREKAGEFLSETGKVIYPELNSLFLLFKLTILIDNGDLNELKLISDELLLFSELLQKSGRNYLAFQLLGKMTELVTEKITNDDFIHWCDEILSVVSTGIHNAVLLEGLSDYLNTVKDILAGAISEYALRKLNNPDPFDPYAIIIPNFGKLYDENLLYVPFNAKSDKIY